MTLSPPYGPWEGISVLDARYLIYYLGTCYVLSSEPLRPALRSSASKDPAGRNPRLRVWVCLWASADLGYWPESSDHVVEFFYYVLPLSLWEHGAQQEITHFWAAGLNIFGAEDR